VKQGHGTFVRRPRIDVTEEAVSNYLRTHSFSLLQLMEVRTPIEVEVAKLAAERREQMHLNSMEESLQVMSVDSNNVDMFSDGDRVFHQAIIDASGNRLFAIMIRSIMGYLHINRQLGIRHFGIQVVFQEHERVFEAIKNQQSSVAAIKMKEHMAQTLMRINKVEELLKRQK
jgi:GntR family transcriptional repressor for pyruvate dehydrogenase complex